MLSNMMQRIPVLARASMVVVALGILAACTFAPLDQAVMGKRTVIGPSEVQVKALIEEKLQTSFANPKVLTFDVVESWFDGDGRFGVICAAVIDSGPPLSPTTGYQQVRPRIFELILEQRTEAWRIKRMKRLPFVQLLPSVDI